jgi:hypothetical protein
VRIDHQEILTFLGSDAQHRAFYVRLGLAKKEATYFIILIPQVPPTLQQYNRPDPSPYSQESYSQESQYGYYQQAPQQRPAFVPNPSFGDSGAEMSTYRVPGPLGLQQHY